MSVFLCYMTDFDELPFQVKKRNWRQNNKKKNRKDLTSSWRLVEICTASVKAQDLVSIPFFTLHTTISMFKYPYTFFFIAWQHYNLFFWFFLNADGLAKKFGLTPEQFGENLRDSYQRHETEQFPAEPVELAKDYVCSQFSAPEAVLEGTRYMVAMQIAREPLVRHVLRQTFQERAKINIKPTKKGKKVWTHLIADIWKPKKSQTSNPKQNILFLTCFAIC